MAEHLALFGYNMSSYVASETQKTKIWRPLSMCIKKGRFKRKITLKQPPFARLVK
jgi:hypothetical protein